MHTLHQMQNSGNCYKLRLLLAQLGVPFRLHDIDILKGESRAPGFLEKNPNGRVPVLELPDGRMLPESNAGLFHLAEGTDLLAEDPFVRAQTLQWMFFEQYSHEPYIAVARFWRTLVPGGLSKKQDHFPEWWERGHQALSVMDRHLQDNVFFAGGGYSIADIALYAYTHVAPEGGFELDGYGSVCAWLERVRNQPGHVPMDWRPDEA